MIGLILRFLSEPDGDNVIKEVPASEHKFFSCGFPIKIIIKTSVIDLDRINVETMSSMTNDQN